MLNKNFVLHLFPIVNSFLSIFSLGKYLSIGNEPNQTNKTCTLCSITWTQILYLADFLLILFLPLLPTAHFFKWLISHKHIQNIATVSQYTKSKYMQKITAFFKMIVSSKTEITYMNNNYILLLYSWSIKCL